MRKLSAFIALCLALVLFTSCASSGANAEPAVSTTTGAISTEATVTTVADTTVAETSATEEAENLYPIPTSDKEPVYDDVIQGFANGTGEDESYNELMDLIELYRTKHDFQFSYYEVEIIERIPDEEAVLLKGFDESKADMLFTYYYVTIIKDLILDEEINKTCIVNIQGNVNCQNYGYPPYVPGDKIAIALSPKKESEDFFREACNYFLGTDIYTSNDTEIALLHLYTIDNLVSKELVLEDSERSVITTTTANPAIYKQKFLLSDLVEFFRQDWVERGFVTLEMIEENNRISFGLEDKTDETDSPVTDETTSAITVPVEETVIPTETQTPVIVTTKPQTPVVTTKPQTPAVTTKPPVTTVKPQTTPAVTTKPVSSTEKLAAVKVIDASNPANQVEVAAGPLTGEFGYNTFSRKTTHGTRFVYPGLTYDTSKTVLLNQENYSELLCKATGARVTYDIDTNTVDDGGHDGVSIYAENDIFRIYVASHRNNFHGTTQDGIDYMLIGNQFLQALAYFGGEDFGDAVWSVLDEYCWVIANNDYTQPIDDAILNKYGFTLVKQGLIGDTGVTEAWWKYGNTTICVTYPCDNDLGHYASTAVNVWFPALGSGKTLTEANLFY